MTTKVVNELRENRPENNSSKPSTGFIDLATYDRLEGGLYSEKKSITYFVRETIRSTWFTQIPIQLQLNQDNPNFGQTFSAKVSREGDYLMNTWLRVSLGAVSIYYPNNDNGVSNLQWKDPNGSGSETMTWTPNFMHNLVEKTSFKVNDNIIDEIYSEHLDFYAAFMIPKARRIGYNRMIGNFSKPFYGLSGANVSGYNTYWSSTMLNYQHELFLPLPFFFTKNTGNALPVSSLPYNDMNIEFKFRNWHELLGSITKDGSILPVNASQIYSSNAAQSTFPTLDNVQVWGIYSIVNDAERKKVACMKRDMVIEQNQQLGGSYGSNNLDVTDINSATVVNLNFESSVKALFFAAKNISGTSQLPYRSNYTTSFPSASDILTCSMSVSGVSVRACTQNRGNNWTGLSVIGGTYGAGRKTPVPINTNSSNVSGTLYNVSGTNIPNMLAPFNVSCVVTGDYNVNDQNINYSFEPNTRGLKDYIDVDSSYWAPTTNGFKAGMWDWGPKLLYNSSGQPLGIIDDISESAGTPATGTVKFDIGRSGYRPARGILTALKTGDYLYLTPPPPGASSGLSSGMVLYNSTGQSIGTVSSATDNTITFNASGGSVGATPHGDGTLVSLSDGDKLYYSKGGETYENNAAPPPKNIELNEFILGNNDRSGFVWQTPPTDPIGTAKILYENESRMEMESLYYGLIQPYYHAKNVPLSDGMKGIYSLKNPNEVSGEPALSVGYHMYSYSVHLNNSDPVGSTNYGNLRNASLIITPSSSAVNNLSKGFGPWRIFVSAISQNVIRIRNGAMGFPIL